MKKTLIVLSILLLFAGHASADFINPGRPITPYLSNLQAVFNGIAVGTPIDAVLNQSNVAVWQPQGSGGSVATFIFTDIANASDVIGLYSYSDPSKRLPVFDGNDAPGTQHVVQFFANGSVQTDFDPNTLVTGFGSTFGYYFLNGGDILPPIAYTEDSLNGGEALALSFAGDGTKTIQIGALNPGSFALNEWIIAFDGYSHGFSNGWLKDFNDAVFLVESVQAAVPEPATMLLLGSGLLGIGIYARKRFKK